jgi:hypothetical protein
MIRTLLIANRGEIARRVVRAAAIVLGLFIPIFAFASPEDTPFEEYLAIRSDVPLWSEYGDGAWPRAHQTDGSFGYHSVFRLGDWRLAESGLCDRAQVLSSACAKWLRLTIISAFHGTFRWITADTRGELEPGHYEIAVIAPLDDDDPQRARLYAVQLGTNPGSQYILVSVNPLPGNIARMTVLAAQCRGNPRTVIRKGPDSIWINRYCVVKTRATLRELAREALNRRPFGSLEWVSASPSESNR